MFTSIRAMVSNTINSPTTPSSGGGKGLLNTSSSSSLTSPQGTVRQSFENILQLIGNNRKLVELKEACLLVVEHLKVCENNFEVERDLIQNPNMYFKVLNMSCKTKQGNIVMIALDLLQQFMEKNYINFYTRFDEHVLITDIMMKTLNECVADVSNQDETLQLQFLKTVLTAISSCHLSGKTLLIGVKLCLNVHFISKNETNTFSVLKQVFHMIINRMGEGAENATGHISDLVDAMVLEFANEMSSSSSSDITKDQEEHQRELNELTQKERDAILLFKYLSTTVTKDFINSPLEEKAKLTYLELLTDVFKNCGKKLLAHQKVFEKVKATICQTLLLNLAQCKSAPIVFSSLTVYQLLMENFLPEMHYEIYLLFFTLIRMIRNKTVNPAFKNLVLSFLKNVTSNADLVMRLYVNFDCKIEKKNILERLMSALVWIVQEYTILNDVNQTMAIKKAALNIFHSMLGSLVHVKEKANNDSSGKPTSTVLSERRKLKKGVELFNENAKKGLEYFTQIGRLPQDKSIDVTQYEMDLATLFNTTAGFSKHSVGEYFASPKNFGVLKKFINMQCFSGILFEKALRKTLDLFMLPKESQEINRVLECFAEKYENDNPDLMASEFKNPSACFVFTISVVMLNTELHNAAMKALCNSTVESFIDRNSLTDASEISKEYQERVYRDLKENEIKLSEDTLAVFDEIDSEVDALEQGIIKSMKKFSSSSAEPFIIEDDFGHFTIISYMLDSFSSTILNLVKFVFDNEKLSGEIHELVLKILLLAIKCSFNVDSPTMRKTFISSLSECTGLKGQLRARHVEALKLLLELAESEGNNIKEGWSDIIDIIAEIDRLHIFDNVSSASDNRTTTPTLKSIDPGLVDRIVFNCEKLNEESLTFFIEGFCKKKSTNLIFYMKKVIESLYLNMNRISTIMDTLWESHICPFISQIASSSKNTTLALYCIDSLCKLCMKLLEQESIVEYQQQFLQPFTRIYQTCLDKEVRKLVTQSVHQIVQIRSAFIKSGWKELFNMLSLTAGFAATESEAFSVLRSIVGDHFEIVQKNSAFKDLIDCLSHFSSELTCKLSIEAIELIEKSSEKMQVVEQMFLDQWYQILSSYASVVSNDNREEVQIKAFKSLHHALLETEQLHLFNQEQWNVIFKGVLLPIFDQFKDDNTSVVWVQRVGDDSLKLLITVFTSYFSGNESALKAIFEILPSCFRKESKQFKSLKLVTVGCSNLLLFIDLFGRQFSEECWMLVCQLVLDLLTENANHPSSWNADTDLCRSETINTVRSIKDYLLKNNKIDSVIQHLIDSLSLCYKNYNSFNSNETNSVTTNQSINVEIQSLTLVFESYFAIYKLMDEKEEGFISTINLIFKQYDSLVLRSQPTTPPPYYFTTFNELVDLLLELYTQLGDDQFLKHWKTLHTSFCSMIMSKNERTRTLTQALFLKFSKLVI